MKSIAVWLLASLALLSPAHAQVTRFEIMDRGPAFGGATSARSARTSASPPAPRWRSIRPTGAMR